MVSVKNDNKDESDTSNVIEDKENMAETCSASSTRQTADPKQKSDNEVQNSTQIGKNDSNEIENKTRIPVETLDESDVRLSDKFQCFGADSKKAKRKKIIKNDQRFAI